MKQWMTRFYLSTLLRALRLLGKQQVLFIVLLLGFCVVELACTVLSTTGVKGAINALATSDAGLFKSSTIYLLLSGVIWWIYAPISWYGTRLATKGRVCDFKTDLLEHIIRLPMRVHDGKSKGELLSAFSNDMNCLHRVYDWDIFQVLRSTTGGIGGLVLMAVIDWRFAIVVFVLGAVSVVVSAHYAKQLEAMGSEQQEQLAKTGTGLYELIKAAKTIRLLSLEARKRQELADNTKKEVDIKEKAMQTTAKLSAAITAISLLTNLAMLFSGALFVYYKLSNWGTVVALLSLKGIADMLFVECGQFIAGMQLNIAGVKRLFALKDVEEEALVLPAFAQNGTNAVLALASVDFSYMPSQPVIRNFSMKLKSRTLMALVGESGCGKSTIMRLILGFYPPDAGSLSFAEETGGMTQRIRAQTAYVPQDPMLFHGSVYENIAFGKEGVTLDDVKRAAKQAGADEFIETMKDGYDTDLSDDGGNLSGGQKQRIAIARALVKDSPILLLDEITSALDEETEAQILQTVNEISKRKAVLLITHKEDVRRWVDEVCAMR